MVVYSVFVPGDPNDDQSYNLFVKCAVNWNISTWEIDLNLFCEHEAQLKYKKKSNNNFRIIPGNFIKGNDSCLQWQRKGNQ